MAHPPPCTCGAAGPIYVGTKELATRLRVTRSTIWRWARLGLITPITRTLGGHPRWDLAAVQRQVHTLTEAGQR